MGYFYFLGQKTDFSKWTLKGEYKKQFFKIFYLGIIQMISKTKFFVII
jgi:hypothetical protein